jgi:hypothetical protein
MTIQTENDLPFRTVTSRTRAWVGKTLAAVVTFSFLAACDGGSRCNENYHALEPGVSCVVPGALCYRNSEGGFCHSISHIPSKNANAMGPRPCPTPAI